MSAFTQERVERALDTMKNAGLSNDQIKEIVAAITEMVATFAREETQRDRG